MPRESGQPSDNAEAQRFAATETEAGKREFLQAALQESFTLDMTQYYPEAEVDHSELIRTLARQHGVDIDTTSALKKAYMLCLQRGDSRHGDQVKEYSRYSFVNVDFPITQEFLAEAVDKVFSAGVFDTEGMSGVEEVENLAKSEGLDFNVPVGVVQACYDRLVREKRTDETDEVIDFARQHKIRLRLLKGKKAQPQGREALIIGKSSEKLRQQFQACLSELEHNLDYYEGGSEFDKDAEEVFSMDELIEVAQKQGVALFPTQAAAQVAYTDAIRFGSLRSAEKIKEYAEKQGMKTTISKSVVQQGYENSIRSGQVGAANKLEGFANKHRIKLTSSPEMAQKGFEAIYRGDYKLLLWEYVEKFDKWCQERGIELQNVKGVRERLYIQVVHNLKLSHAQDTRNRVLNHARTAGSTLTYEEVAKMDYLKELNVPEEQQLRQTTEAHVDGHPLTVRLYGQRQDKPMEGKFIVGITPEQSLELAFDGTLGEHGDIGVKYDLQVIGGGWLKINEQEKRVTISKQSQDFGFDPRSITTRALAEAFPGYAVETE